MTVLADRPATHCAAAGLMLARHGLRNASAAQVAQVLALRDGGLDLAAAAAQVAQASA